MEHETNNGRVVNFDNLKLYFPTFTEPTPEQQAEYDTAVKQVFSSEIYELVKSFFAIEAEKAREREPGHNRNTIEPVFTAVLAYYAGKRAGIREERARKTN